MRRILCLLAALAALAPGPGAADDFRLLRIDGLRMKWGAPVLGTGAEVSYALAGERRLFRDAINCGVLDGALGLGGPAAHDRLQAGVAAAFAMWDGVAGIDFRVARAGEAPDILIGAQGEPRGIAFANVWHDAAAAERGVAPLTRATICLNPRMPWLAPPEAGAQGYDLVTVLAHEIGHAIGLDHPGPIGALMGYRNQGLVATLLPGDRAGALALYGPPG